MPIAPVGPEPAANHSSVRANAVPATAVARTNRGVLGQCPTLYPTSVRKSSVYLTDRLKGRLKGLAEATGASEADLIRQAIEQLVDGRAPNPSARSWVDRSPAAVFGVGVGPGDASLLTLRALDVLRGVDRVFAPTAAPDAVGRAEMIVRDASPDVPIERLVFVMERAGRGRDDAIESAGARLVECVEAGERVAFVTLGDPNVYSTFSSVAEVVARLRPGTPVETVPGIMAFQDLAARSGTVIVDGAESFVVVPALGDDDQPVTRALAETDQAIVLYKGGRHLPRIATQLEEAGRLPGAVLGELLGLPGERMQPVAEVADRPASYLATVIVPPVRAPSRRRSRARAKATRSA